MPNPILIDEFHVSMFVPRTLPDAECTAICRTLKGKRFGADLRRAVQGAVRRHPSLARIQVRITC